MFGEEEVTSLPGGDQFLEVFVSCNGGAVVAESPGSAGDIGSER